MIRAPARPSGLAIGRTRLETALCLAGIFLASMLLTFQGYRAVRALSTDQTLDYAEPFVVDAAIRPATWFGSLKEAPYRVTNYPPVYLVATGVVARALPGHVYLPGRLVSLLSLIAASLLIALLARQLAGVDAKAAGLLAAGFFLLSPYARWGFLVRVDTLGVALSLGAVWLIGSGRRRAAVVTAGLLCALAVGTKQTFLAAPVAIGLYLAWRKEWRSVAWFLGSWAAGIGVLAGWLIVAYGAAPVWRHLVLYNENTFKLAYMLFAIQEAIATHAIVIVLAAAAFKWGDSDGYKLLGLYTGLACLGFLTVGKIGANYNYFLEPLAAASVLAGVLAAKLLRSRELGARWWRPALLFALCIQGAVYVNPSSGFFEGWDAVRRDLVDVRGSLLAGDAGFNLVLGKPIYYQPLILKLLIDQGEVPRDPLVGPLSHGAFDRIVLNRSYNWRQFIWTKEQRELFDACYRVSVTQGAFEILEPNTESKPCRAARAELSATRSRP